MVKRLVSVEELRKRHGELKRDVGNFLILGDGFDRDISGVKLEKIHEGMRKSISEYEKTNDLLHLARVHDFNEDFRMENPFSTTAADFQLFLKQALSKTPQIKRLNGFWRRVEKRKLCISPKIR